MRYPQVNFSQDIKHLVSTLFALVPMLVLYFVISPISAVLDLSQFGESTRIILISVIVSAVTAVSCYFICRHNPGSAWYVPAFVTAGTVWLISDLLSSYWTRNSKMWLLIAALVLATVSGILGSIKGEQVHKE